LVTLYLFFRVFTGFEFSWLKIVEFFPNGNLKRIFLRGGIDFFGLFFKGFEDKLVVRKRKLVSKGPDMCIQLGSGRRG